MKPGSTSSSQCLFLKSFLTEREEIKVTNNSYKFSFSAKTTKLLFCFFYIPLHCHGFAFTIYNYNSAFRFHHKLSLTSILRPKQVNFYIILVFFKRLFKVIFCQQVMVSLSMAVKHEDCSLEIG